MKMLAIYKQYKKQIIIGSSVIALVLASGGLYWFTNRKNSRLEEKLSDNGVQQVTTEVKNEGNSEVEAQEEKTAEPQGTSQFPIGMEVEALYSPYEGVIIYSGTVVKSYEETGKVLRLARGNVHESNYTEVVDIHVTEKGWSYGEREMEAIAPVTIRAVYTRDSELMPLRELDGKQEKIFSYKIIDTISTDKQKWHSFYPTLDESSPEYVKTFLREQGIE